MSTIRRKVEWVKLKYLSETERVLILRVFKFRSLNHKVQVVYSDDESAYGKDANVSPACWFSFHESDCALYAAWGRATSHAAPTPVAAAPAAPEYWGWGAGDWNAEPDIAAVAPRPSRICACKHSAFGDWATRMVERNKSTRLVLWRFVPRPLTLEQALEFNEVADVQDLLVSADRLLEQGHPLGQRIMLAIHSRRQHDAT